MLGVTEMRLGGGGMGCFPFPLDTGGVETQLGSSAMDWELPGSRLLDTLGDSDCREGVLG